MLGRLLHYSAQKGIQPEGRPKSPLNPPMEFDQPKEKAVGLSMIYSGATLMTPFALSQGLLVTEEFEKAVRGCKAEVTRLAKECQRQNRRYRDLSFDMYDDRDRCLFGLTRTVDANGNVTLTPSDVLRATQIFEKPQFFIDGASSGDIIQGALGDCWFLSALAMVGAVQGLFEKICVAQDEKFGIYGFVFFKETGWVSVVIDDLLFSGIPKYESLTGQARAMHKEDRDLYNRTARMGRKSLYFGSSGTENETWVALIEKAYAKLNGDFMALEGGSAREAVEDLTGGVSSLYAVPDLFDIDQFWTEELMHANEDRLFGCFVDSDGGNGDPLNGILRNHAYSIIRAMVINGKRFLKIRNPWGDTEWTGRWSDGSKEWTKEWLDALPELGHKFGDDGEFLMEYSDFLSIWTAIERVRLFDSTWAMSSHWLCATGRPLRSAWSFGDVSFTINISSPTPAVIVLAQVDTRSFAEIAGPYRWSLEFALYKKGESEPIGRSVHDRLYGRSVQMELDLAEGDYVVHVRFDRAVLRTNGQINDILDGANSRKAAQKLASALQSEGIASNFSPANQTNLLPIPEDLLAGKSLAELEEALAKAAAESDRDEGKGTTDDAPASPTASMAPAALPTVVAEPETRADAPVVEERTAGAEAPEEKGTDAADAPAAQQADAAEQTAPPVAEAVHVGYGCDNCRKHPIRGPRYRCTSPTCEDFDLCQSCLDLNVHDQGHPLLRIHVALPAPACPRPPDAAADVPRPASPRVDMSTPLVEKERTDDDVTLGLKVYTKRTATATVKSQLRQTAVAQLLRLATPRSPASAPALAPVAEIEI